MDKTTRPPLPSGELLIDGAAVGAVPHRVAPLPETLAPEVPDLGSPDLGSPDRRALIRFILGELPEVERAEFEERALYDEAFFTELSAVEADLVDAWVRGELSAERAWRLGEILGASPGGQARLHFATSLAAWLHSREREIPGKIHPFRLARARRRPAWWGHRALTAVALAASLLLAVLGAWLLVDRRELARQLTAERETAATLEAEIEATREQIAAARQNTLEGGEQTASELAALVAEAESLREALTRARQAGPPEPPSTPEGRARTAVPFLLTFAATVRGLEEPHHLLLGPEVQTVELTVDLGDDHGYSSYRAALRTARGDELWSRGDLAETTTAWGRVVKLEIPASSLTGGDYELILLGRGEEGSEEVGYYPFRVARQP